MNISVKYRLAAGSRDQGFTLVELMIAMVLGVVLIGGVISVLLANKQSAKTNSALSQLQDNSRTAFEMMARDIRQAGSTPCGNTAVTNNLNSLNGANTDWYLWGNSIQGADNATTASPALPGAIAQSGIATHGEGPVSTSLITAGAACANGAPLATAPAGINAGDLVMACDTNQAYIFQTAAFAGGILPVAAIGAGGAPGNAAATLGCGSFAQSAYVAPYEADYWYVRAAGTGAPANTLSLYRARYSAGVLQSNEIIRGVRELLITYHTTGATGFVSATAVGAAWSAVDAVRVTLTLQSLDARSGVGTNVAQPTSLMRTFTTTIGIR